MNWRCLLRHDWRQEGPPKRVPDQYQPTLYWTLIRLRCHRCRVTTTVDEHEYYWGYTDEVR